MNILTDEEYDGLRKITLTKKQASRRLDATRKTLGVLRSYRSAVLSGVHPEDVSMDGWKQPEEGSRVGGQGWEYVGCEFEGCEQCPVMVATGTDCASLTFGGVNIYCQDDEFCYGERVAALQWWCRDKWLRVDDAGLATKIRELGIETACSKAFDDIERFLMGQEEWLESYLSL